MPKPGDSLEPICVQNVAPQKQMSVSGSFCSEDMASSPDVVETNLYEFLVTKALESICLEYNVVFIGRQTDNLVRVVRESKRRLTEFQTVQKMWQSSVRNIVGPQANALAWHEIDTVMADMLQEDMVIRTSGLDEPSEDRSALGKPSFFASSMVAAKAMEFLRSAATALKKTAAGGTTPTRLKKQQNELTVVPAESPADSLKSPEGTPLGSRILYSWRSRASVEQFGDKELKAKFDESVQQELKERMLHVAKVRLSCVTQGRSTETDEGLPDIKTKEERDKTLFVVVCHEKTKSVERDLDFLNRRIYDWKKSTDTLRPRLVALVLKAERQDSAIRKTTFTINGWCMAQELQAKTIPCTGSAVHEEIQMQLTRNNNRRSLLVGRAGRSVENFSVMDPPLVEPEERSCSDCLRCWRKSKPPPAQINKSPTFRKVRKRFAEVVPEELK